MDDTTLKSYLEAWSMTCNSTPESIERMIAGAHPDIRFSDVNAPNVRDGHEGIRAICGLASSHYSGATISYDSLLFDGRNWAIRWRLTWPRLDGTERTCRGASAGTVADDGRIIEHTDYWSRATFQADD